jgi:hypothetical protein
MTRLVVAVPRKVRLRLAASVHDLSRRGPPPLDRLLAARC